jgi:DNA-binding Lrp family transcriptional regulator
MAKRRRRHLDAIDRALCHLLVQDPRSSQRWLAEQVGVSDETVGARLRRLREDHVVATTVAVDWQAAGYGAAAVVRAKLTSGVIADLAEERHPVLEIGGIQSVTLTTGGCDVVLGVLAVDLPALRDLVTDTIRGLGVVSPYAVDVATAAASFDLSMLTLPLRTWSATELPCPDPPLDDLDRALIGELAQSGHESNRELARRLDVSDGTVRARIRRLEEGGLIRLIAGRDPVATDELRAHAIIFLTLGDDFVESRVVSHPLVWAAHRCIGAADLIVQVGARSQAELSAYATHGLRSVPGVRWVEVAHVVEVVKHQTHLVRFVDDDAVAREHERSA